MPTEMFDEILDQVGPRIAKQHTFWRAPRDPGMKLAITLRHPASGTKWLGLLALLWPGPSVPPASNKPSSCGSWTSAASGSVFGQLDLSQCLDLHVLGCHWQRKERELLKLVFPDSCPYLWQQFSIFPFVAYLTCISDERKNCVTKFRFDGLFICAFSVMWPVQTRSTYVRRPFYPFLMLYMFVFPVCVRYLYGSYATRPLLVLYMFGSRTVIVRFMRFIFRFRWCLEELKFRFSPPDNNGCNSTRIFFYPLDVR